MIQTNSGKGSFIFPEHQRRVAANEKTLAGWSLNVAEGVVAPELKTPERKVDLSMTATGNADIDRPGYLEVDTVAHGGDSWADDHVWTLTLTDIGQVT